MTARSSESIKRSLLTKGFRKSDTHHQYLILWIDGMKTNIKTKISHGKMDYGDALLSAVKTQLKLSNKKLLLDLIDCPMELDDYISELNKNNHL